MGKKVKAENKDKEKDSKKRENIVTCGNCGYSGPDSEFMDANPDDSICPECGEKDNLIYEM